MQRFEGVAAVIASSRKRRRELERTAVVTAVGVDLFVGRAFVINEQSSRPALRSGRGATLRLFGSAPVGVTRTDKGFVLEIAHGSGAQLYCFPADRPHSWWESASETNLHSKEANGARCKKARLFHPDLESHHFLYSLSGIIE